MNILKKKITVFIGTSSFKFLDKKKINKLKKKNIEIKLNPKKRKLNENELIFFAKNSDIIIAGTEIYSNKTLSEFKNLKFLFRLGAGDENIDHKSIKDLKIKYKKSKVTPYKSVAELIIVLILSLLRKIIEHNNTLRKYNWKKRMGNLLFGKTVGIIGFGKVGKYLTQLIKNFGVKLLIHDPIKTSKYQTSLQNLLKKSDIISLCASYNGGPPLLNKKKLNLIKKNAILINTSRAELLDYKHLYDMMIKDNIAGIGLDVFEEEPYKGKFINSNKNIILTPHIGSYALEIRKKMEEEAINSVIKYLYGNKKYNF
jgi:D-3-phosphoglycerate dehydrogenase